ncbi:MAG: prephenate dehydratase domain-containing protein [Peptostreptococcales bacterium]
MKKKIGYQGVPGSFSQQALSEYFSGANPEELLEFHFPEFEDIFINLENNTIDYGILPIENTSTGGIAETYHLLNEYDVYIVGEWSIQIEHHLLGLPGSSIHDLKQVYSHPQAYEQSKPFFKEQGHIKFIPHNNTADSARLVMTLADKSIGAISSKKAASIYNLAIIAPGINFSSKNYTRFVILSKRKEFKDTADKISLVLTVAHSPGSLYKVMRHFEEAHLNLTKIESRPIIGKPFHYLFYLDFNGNIKDASVMKALERVKNSCLYYKFLGNYPSYSLPSE